MQLERKQKQLDKQHDSMSATVKSLDKRNSEAIAEIRTHVNTFLTELISVVGRQFEKTQADLANSHADTIRVSAAPLLSLDYACKPCTGFKTNTHLFPYSMR